MEKKLSDEKFNEYYELASVHAKQNSNCLKKKVGCVIINSTKKDCEWVIGFGYGGRPEAMGPCEKCYADCEKFFHDSCNSVHSEQRAVINALENGNALIGRSIIITHGPCDQCMKLLILVGIKRVFYKHPYKTDFTRYKGLIEVYEGEEQRRII